MWLCESRYFQTINEEKDLVTMWLCESPYFQTIYGEKDLVTIFSCSSCDGVCKQFLGRRI